MYPSIPPEAAAGVIQVFMLIIATVAFFVGLVATARS